MINNSTDIYTVIGTALLTMALPTEMISIKEDRLKRKSEAKAAKMAKFNNKTSNKTSNKSTNPTNPTNPTKTKTKVTKADNNFSNLPKYFDPTECEAKWYEWWIDQGFFKPDYSKQTKFTMIMPPPNVTGSLHIGHAMTNAIQDLIVRWHRMHGECVMWIPGTDHAGIATQTVVEKQLFNTSGLTKNDIGREKFVAQIWEWKDLYRNKICNQIKKLGSSVDWSAEVFTLDQNFTNAVHEAFIRCFDNGLITRSNKLVNWSSSLRTCVSNIECDNTEILGSIYQIAYKIADSDDEIIVSTTRPETIFGDTAIAVHPDDNRYSRLHGKKAVHPFLNKHIDIICDPILVHMDFGTGAVKVTPGHNQNDFDCAVRNNLAYVNIFNDDGTLGTNCGEFSGLDKNIARNKVIDKLSSMGLFRSETAYKHIVKTCSRSGDIIEPMLKPQWWLDMKLVAKQATEYVDSGKLKINPEFKKKEWDNYLNNIEPWCISRQLWWGHQVPVWMCKKASDCVESSGCVELDNSMESDTHVWVAARNIDHALAKASDKMGIAKADIVAVQDPDVLDTWFSSALYPFAAVGWPQTDTQLYQLHYPGQILETGYDILFFWVAKMVMMGLYLTSVLPFTEILLHGIVRDSCGVKMSKSTGNVIDPLSIIDGATITELNDSIRSGNLKKSDIDFAIKEQAKNFPTGIKQYGADTLRFALCSYVNNGNDINFDITRITATKSFCNKIWNSFRFAHEQLKSYDPNTDTIGYDKLLVTDKWILSRLSISLKLVEKSFADRNFVDMTSVLRSFWVSDFCDIYLEIVKKNISQHKHILYTIIESGLRALHPIMPFITEDLWQRLSHRTHKSICIAPYPKSTDYIECQASVETFVKIDNLVCGIRTLGNEYKINRKMRVVCKILNVNSVNIGVDNSIDNSVDNSVDNNWISQYVDEICALANLAKLEIVDTDSTYQTDIVTGISYSGVNSDYVFKYINGHNICLEVVD